jgi:putative membrane protein insertion efficiency factor
MSSWREREVQQSQSGTACTGSEASLGSSFGRRISGARSEVMAAPLERLRWLAVLVVEAPIRFYRRFVSPALPRRCKYEPSCSSYALSAVRSYGVGRGVVLAGWRLLRCNPFSHGGYDPVEAQKLFRSKPMENP